MTKFLKTFPILYGDCQAEGYVQPINFMKYIMETAVCHSESTSYPMDRLAEEGCGWMLYLSHYKFYAYPTKKDMVTFVTYPMSFDRFFAGRGIEAYCGEELLAVVSTRWFMYNFETGKPENLKGEWLKALGETEELPETHWELKRPRYRGEWKLGFSSQVLTHEIDFNRHANNIFYWNWMASGLPKLKPLDLPDEIYISYKNQVKFGDKYESFWAPAEKEKSFYHKIVNADGDIAAEAISLWK